MILKCVGIALIFVDVTCTEVSAPPPAAVCPPVREWSREFQKKAADEMRAAPNSVLSQIATQAIGDRDVARKCRAAKRRR